MIKTIGVILASGVGQRYGSKIPKQFIKLNGISIIYYSLNEFIKSNSFDKIIIAINDLNYSYLFKNYNVDVILGGRTRNESIWNCIEEAKKYNPKYILFHDAIRPLIKSEDFKLYLNALKSNDAAITTEKITDSLFHASRENYKLIQTPEAFRFDKLYNSFKKDADCTAIYEHIFPCDIKFIQLNHPNYKITYPYDLFMLEHLIKYCSYKKNKPNLTGMNILLLGASGGIGSAVYKELQKYNPNKIYTPISKELNLNQEFLSYLLSHTYNDVNIIINCSGVMETDNNILLTSNYEKIMNINFKANISLIDYAKTLPNKPINIVFISSSAATKGRPNLTIYSASKVALHSLIESQAINLAREGIYINVLCPEKVNTNLLKKHESEIDNREVLEPKEIAKAILNYCNTDEYGKIIHLRKGMNLE